MYNWLNDEQKRKQKEEEQQQQMEQLAILTGFDKKECEQLLTKTGWSIKGAIGRLNSYIAGTSSLYSTEVIEKGIRNAELYEKLSNNLSNLNTMRGGTNGFKGFIFEELHATNATINGRVTNVINNNGIADFAVINADGTITYAQAKVGYGTGKIDFTAYKDQTIVVDKGNTYLIKKAKEAGLEVVESDISSKEAARLAKQMQLESKVTRRPNSVVVPKAHTAINIAKESHRVGVQSAKTGAQFGGGFSLGSNIVDVLSGEKKIRDAAKGVAVDTAVSTGIGYASGAAATVIGQTALGSTVAGAVGTATSAIAGTAVGGATIAAGTAAVGTIGGIGTTVATTAIAAGTAAGGAVVTAGAAVSSAIASTAVGGAVATAGTAIAGTAVGGAVVAAGTAATGAVVATGAAVAAAAVAAAPVVAVGAVLGGLYGIGRKLLRKR
ncbi:hypothetical protein M2277_001878 [Paenibacillus sp. LBL]|uniref:hypothetical protein n=1 Tax=Paenibacillus sp. LBL TaxID=2940563 RepID=UPI0024746062|nr:hypothetical protein [Paenibacillus sp. LBL]MDH6671228.1 hypothetical protein [Paenibacillus sp. LBL]